MKIISLNGKWKSKPDYHNLGIEYKWYSNKNLVLNNDDLLDIDIPKSFNLIERHECFEGIFWHFYEFDLNEPIKNLDFDYSLRFKGSNYNTKAWLNGIFIGEHNG